MKAMKRVPMNVLVGEQCHIKSGDGRSFFDPHSPVDLLLEEIFIKLNLITALHELKEITPHFTLKIDGHDMKELEYDIEDAMGSTESEAFKKYHSLMQENANLSLFRYVESGSESDSSMSEYSE
jgi:hypothetical protein